MLYNYSMQGYISVASIEFIALSPNNKHAAHFSGNALNWNIFTNKQNIKQL